MKYKTALLIGRFQPLHNGHLYLFKKALFIAEKVIFGIGSASIYDENNPFSYEQRKTMIETVVKNERISERVMKIVPLEDFYDDKKWLENLCKQVGDFDIAMGNNEWTNSVLKKAGYKTIKINHYKRELYEGWRIRKLIRSSLSSRAKSRDLDWQNRVPKYLISNIKDQISKTQIKNQKYKYIVLGGTFDHFHAGHKALLKKAFELGKNVTIGISTEKLYKDKFLFETIESYEIRKKSVEKFIKKYLTNGRGVDIISLFEFRGGADNIKNIEAIIVSKSTYPNALIINQLREKNKLPLLRIVIADDVLADDGKLISSERIRAGEIDRTGQVYSNFFKKTLVLSEAFKEKLRKPMGKIYKSVGAIFKSPEKPTMVIAVGDIIAMELEKERLIPDVKIIDYKTRRTLLKGSVLLRSVPNTINDPGTINPQSAKAVKLAINKFLSTKKSQTIIINGEEDLLALPAILFAPLNSLVLHGHWQYGIIAIKIDEEIKNKILNLLKQIS